MTLSRMLTSVALWAGLCGAAAAATPADAPPDCTQATAPLELASCFMDHLDTADAALNTVYAQARSELKQQAADGSCSRCAAAEKTLVKAQRTWITLRDADCSAVYAFNADGTSRNPAEMRCLITHTRDRTRQLRDFYELR